MRGGKERRGRGNMFLINMDTVYELTILLCGLQRETESERERVDGTNRECMQKLTAKHEKGSFGEKRKYSSGKGGRRSACGSS